ncbi:MAG TPA: hypothetical protein VJ725_23920 [Thermoanaerobaculia bacterium]|nr:hypothetical protein [Thermoanaerobaculia bacterium]
MRSWGEALSPYWVPFVTDLVAAPLSVEQKTLGILVLLLRRAPALVRSDRFAREIVAWIESERRREAERVESPAPRPAHPKKVEEPRRDAFREDIGNSSEAVASTAERPAAQEVEPAPAAPEVPLTSFPELETLKPPQPDVAIASDFAGVFFLLNAGIALGLYSDFTSPVQTGIDLEIWDFLALTGGALADFGDDPIGPLLALLANRQEGEPPGARFVPPEGQTLPEWLAATVERLRERLALAGIEDPSQVVRRFGRVTTTPAHLDVYFSLAAHPIEIRCAGLDRDPGWIPAAGRHVAFHFD